MLDYGRALDLDHTLTGALSNRAMLHYKETRAALEQALKQGADPADSYYNLALIDVGG